MRSSFLLFSATFALLSTTAFASVLLDTAPAALDSFFRNPARERDLLVILDESGSIGTANFEYAKSRLASVLGYICPGIGPSYPFHQVAFMTFSSHVAEHFDFNDYGTYAGVRDAILRVPYSGGGTETQLAFDYARTTMFNDGDFSSSTKGLRPGSMKEVLLITDGPPTDLSATVAAAERLRNIGVDVFALGIGNIDYNYLDQLVSDPSYPHMFHLSVFGDFHEMVDTITEVVVSGFGSGMCVSFNPWTGRRRR